MSRIVRGQGGVLTQLNKAIARSVKPRILAKTAIKSPRANAFADADGVDRDFEFLGQGEQYASARSSADDQQHGVGGHASFRSVRRASNCSLEGGDKSTV